MLKIWGRLSSLNVRKVVLAAQELAIPFERVDAGASFGIVRTPDYLAKNPNALVPVAEDDQVQLWESNVIVRGTSGRACRGRGHPAAPAWRCLRVRRFRGSASVGACRGRGHPAAPRDRYLRVRRFRGSASVGACRY